MPLFGKPKLSEFEAAAQFVKASCQKVPESWPSTAELLRPMLGEDAAVLDDDFASYEFALAVIAIQLQALPNLLPADQASRIREHVIECLKTEELGIYPQQAIEEYQNAWDGSWSAGELPHNGVASVLFDKLGCSSTVSGDKERFKDPVVLMALGAAVMDYALMGPWKNVVEKFTLIA